MKKLLHEREPTFREMMEMCEPSSSADDFSAHLPDITAIEALGEGFEELTSWVLDWDVPSPSEIEQLPSCSAFGLRPGLEADHGYSEYEALGHEFLDTQFSMELPFGHDPLLFSLPSLEGPSQAGQVPESAASGSLDYSLASARAPALQMESANSNASTATAIGDDGDSKKRKRGKAASGGNPGKKKVARKRGSTGRGPGRPRTDPTATYLRQIAAFNASGGFNLIEPGSEEEGNTTSTSKTAKGYEPAADSVCNSAPSSQPDSTS